MTISTIKVNQIAAYLLALCCSYNTVASETNEASDGFIIFAALNKNEYLGSDDKEIVPAIISTFNLFGNKTTIEGLAARTELYAHNNWHAGLAVQFDFGRDKEVSNKTIAALKKIKANINIGGYLSYTNNNLFLNGDEFELRFQSVHDVSSVHKGTLSTFTSTYTLPLFIPWRVEFELESSFADENYMDSYLSINQSDSLISGLTEYQASAGFLELNLNANVILFSNPSWATYMRIGYSRLLNDAAKSPIVKEQGSKNQSQLGFGLFYRF